MALSPSVEQGVIAFMKATPLMPVVVLDGINAEMCSLLRDASEADVETLYEHLRSDAALERILTKTGNAFLSCADFQKAISVPDARPAYHDYMRDWVLDEMKEYLPALAVKLPSALPKGMTRF
jgi:hypothetical protein